MFKPYWFSLLFNYDLSFQRYQSWFKGRKQYKDCKNLFCPFPSAQFPYSLPPWLTIGESSLILHSICSSLHHFTSRCFFMFFHYLCLGKLWWVFVSHIFWLITSLKGRVMNSVRLLYHVWISRYTLCKQYHIRLWTPVIHVRLLDTENKLRFFKFWFSLRGMEEFWVLICFSFIYQTNLI
jgi:hypothetical protein